MKKQRKSTTLSVDLDEIDDEEQEKEKKEMDEENAMV